MGARDVHFICVAVPVGDDAGDGRKQDEGEDNVALVVDALNCRGPYEAAAGRDLAVLLDKSAVQYPHHAEVK